MFWSAGARNAPSGRQGAAWGVLAAGVATKTTRLCGGPRTRRNANVLERFTGAPRVLVRGRVAQVWGEYEFLRDGKFSHCGVDAVSLFKTVEGWKIATIVYTAETTGCRADSRGN